MNLILTNQCNNNCSFCFAKKFKTEKEQWMTLDEIKKKTASLPRGAKVSLLGGEPTLHPQIKEILEYLVSSNLEILVISNLLFSSEVRGQLLKFRDILWLANASEIVPSKKKLWIENFISLKNNLSNNLHIGVGITLNNSLKDPLGLLKDLHEMTDFRSLRLSIDFSQRFENIYHNFVLGEQIEKIINWAGFFFIRPTIDCVIPPCLFRNDFTVRTLYNTLNYNKPTCKGAYDHFPSGKISYCFPLKDRIYSDEKGSLNFKSQYESLQRKILPKECKECPHKEKGLCSGAPLCLLA